MEVILLYAMKDEPAPDNTIASFYLPCKTKEDAIEYLTDLYGNCIETETKYQDFNILHVKSFGEIQAFGWIQQTVYERMQS